MILVDTHAHLDFPQFDDDREEVLERARRAGVRWVVNVGASLQASRVAVELARTHDGVFAAVGVHPHDAKDVDERTLQEVEELAREDVVVAVGEVGLDFYRNLSPRGAQEYAFKAFLEIAERVGKPVIIHARDATSEVLRLLEEEGPIPSRRGVFHCWSSSVANAARATGMGFLVSVTGNVTYPNAGKLRRKVAAIGLSSLMVETDAPFLAPQVHRGKRCEPAHVLLVAEELAGIFGAPLEEVARVTTSNATRLFGLPEA